MMDYVAEIKEPIKSIGDYSFTGVIDSYFGAEIKIGKFTSIAPPLYVHGATEHRTDMVSTFPFGDKWEVDYPKAFSKGAIEIGNDVWIGESVTLLSGVKIGDGAVVGARAVIAKDISPYAIAVGNPARIVRYRFSPKTIEKLLKIKWWDWTKEKIMDNMEYFKDIDNFIEKFYEQ